MFWAPSVMKFIKELLVYQENTTQQHCGFPRNGVLL